MPLHYAPTQNDTIIQFEKPINKRLCIRPDLNILLLLLPFYTQHQHVDDFSIGARLKGTARLGISMLYDKGTARLGCCMIMVRKVRMLYDNGTARLGCCMIMVWCEDDTDNNN